MMRCQKTTVENIHALVEAEKKYRKNLA